MKDLDLESEFIHGRTNLGNQRPHNTSATHPGVNRGNQIMVWLTSLFVFCAR